MNIKHPEFPMNENFPFEYIEQNIVEFIGESRKTIEYVNAIRKQLMFIEERINSLYLENHSMREVIEDMRDEIQPPIRIPHRCPGCYGEKFDYEGILCHICNGTGVVWG